METVLIILGIVLIVLGIIGIVFASFYNRFQTLFIRIREAEDAIELLLQKKLDNLTKWTSTIKEIDTGLEQEEALLSFVKMKNKKLDRFSLDRELNVTNRDFRELLEAHPELVEKEELLQIQYELLDIDNDLKASKKFYNHQVEKFDALLHTFPANLLAFLFHYKRKELYLIEKEEMFEILKDKK